MNRVPGCSCHDSAYGAHTSLPYAHPQNHHDDFSHIYPAHDNFSSTCQGPYLSSCRRISPCRGSCFFPDLFLCHDSLLIHGTYHILPFDYRLHLYCDSDPCLCGPNGPHLDLPLSPRVCIFFPKRWLDRQTNGQMDKSNATGRGGVHHAKRPLVEGIECVCWCFF